VTAAGFVLSFGVAYRRIGRHLGDLYVYSGLMSQLARLEGFRGWILAPASRTA
jgi:hypothetical protein